MQSRRWMAARMTGGRRKDSGEWLVKSGRAEGWKKERESRFGDRSYSVLVGRRREFRFPTGCTMPLKWQCIIGRWPELKSRPGEGSLSHSLFSRLITPTGCDGL